MKPVTQTHPTESKLVRANAAFKNKEYQLAVTLYEDALEQSDEPLKTQIQFNLNLVLRRLGQSSGASKLEVEKKDIKNKLAPINHLELDVDDSKYWKSVGDDPHFYLESDQKIHFESGWYQIELLIESSRSTNMAKFYMDNGQGYTENDAISLPYKSQEQATKVVFFKEFCSAIRFDPKESDGRFRIISLHISPITISDAEDAMLQQLSNYKTKAKLKDATPNQIKLKLQERAKDKQSTLIQQIEIDYQKLFTVGHDAISYEDWIEQVEKLSLPTTKQVKENITKLSPKPLISVVMPVFNTDEKYLCACIDSVIAQTYPHWELCIADDASSMPHVRRVLETYEKEDARIKVVYRPENGHISRASNSALEIARGQFVALLDHDDALPDYALYFMALAINASPDAQVLYSDEDKLDQNGERFAPHFKSDWNPDLFFSQNYVSHLGVYRRNLLTHINGFRPGVEGSQDQDLLLRCLPHVRHDQIIHIPRVLYHWRMVEGSTALASGEKSYTTTAGVKALQDYFQIVNPLVTVEAAKLPNTYRVRWPLPESAPLVSLLIPTRDRRALTETCVRSIIDRSTYTNYEILILDNGSVESETLDFFEQIQKEDRRVRVLRYDHPFNYSAINNFGVLHAHGDVIGLVNNDIEVISAEWLTEMLSHALRPDIGCVGAKLYYSNDTLQHGGVILGIGGVANHSHKNFERDSAGYFGRLFNYQNYSAVTAACLLVRREVYDQVGGLDEVNLAIAFNDVDFCLKVREAGYRNLWTPYAELYHYESISRGVEDTPEKQTRFRGEVEFMKNKWSTVLDFDPFYNINLTKSREDFSIAW
jgi:GT2 family glycosyltransferase